MSAIEKNKCSNFALKHNPKKELFFEKRIALAVRPQFTIAYNVQLHNNQQPITDALNLPISVSVGGRIQTVFLFKIMLNKKKIVLRRQKADFRKQKSEKRQ